MRRTVSVGEVGLMAIIVTALALLVTTAAFGQTDSGRSVSQSVSRSDGQAVSLFADTTLTRLIGEALQANRDVVKAQARVRQAQASRLHAQLDLAPGIEFAAGYTRQRISSASFGFESPDRGLYDVGIVGAWEVDVFGRLRKNLKGRNALAESANEDVREVGRIVTAELATAYFDLRGAQDQLLVARRNADNQRRTLSITQSRLSVGRGTAFDTERAQAQLSTTEALVPRLEARIAAAEHRIGVLVGRDPRIVTSELAQTCDPELGEECKPAELPVELTLPDTDSIIRSRPDVRSAERRLSAEGAFVGAAKAEYLPKFSLGGTAGYTTTEFDAVGKTSGSRFAVGPMVRWPFLNMGRVKANVDAARAFEAEAKAEYEQVILLAREELRTALVAYAKARERLTKLEAAAAASSRAAELAQIRFEGGVADFLQVLDAQRSALITQDQLAQGRTDAVTALVAVYRASGDLL